jgi:hypothetical protein
VTKIYEMPGDDLANYGLSWVPLREIMPWCDESDDCCVLCFDHGRYPVSGIDLSRIEDAVERDVPKAKIIRYLQGMAYDLERGG